MATNKAQPTILSMSLGKEATFVFSVLNWNWLAMEAHAGKYH